MGLDPRPCSAATALERAQRLLTDPALDNASACYVYGGGDYFDADSAPWTLGQEGIGGDCRVPFLWCYQVPAHRPGYNLGPWASVSDDINYNSLIEDSEHGRDLVVPVTDAPQPGDVLCYPTIRLQGHTFIGHGAIILDASGWTGAFHSLVIIQVCGPPGRSPAAIKSDGSVFDQHSTTWPKPEHRSRLLRVVA